MEVIAFETTGAGEPGIADEERVESGMCWDQVYVGTNHRPTVVIEEPSEGIIPAMGPITLRWRAEDADGDAVTVEVCKRPVKCIFAGWADLVRMGAMEVETYGTNRQERRTPATGEPAEAQAWSPGAA